MAAFEDNIARLEKALADARGAVRDVHSSIKQAKQTIKALEAEHNRWSKGIQEEVDAALQRQVEMGLESFREDVRKATQTAHQKVIQEFEKLTNIMMTGTEDGSGDRALVPEWITSLIRKEITKAML